MLRTGKGTRSCLLAEERDEIFNFLLELSGTRDIRAPPIPLADRNRGGALLVEAVAPGVLGERLVSTELVSKLQQPSREIGRSRRKSGAKGGPISCCCLGTGGTHLSQPGPPTRYIHRHFALTQFVHALP